MNFKGKIYISNNGVTITPYNRKDCSQLEHLTSMYDEVYHKRNEVTGFVLKYDDEKDAFITHQQNVKYIQNLFPEYEVEYMKETTSTKISHEFGLDSSITPTDIQYDIISKILNMKNEKEWFVHLQTAYGKTLLSIYLSSIFNYKTMIMCFSVEILSQWMKTIKKKTTFPPDRLLLIDSSKILQGILDDTFDYKKYDIFLCTPKILTSFCNKKGYDKLNIIFNKIGIGLKIFDEAHRNMANLIKINASTNTRYTLYLSADFGQADPELEQKYFKIFYKVPIITPDEKFKETMRYTQAVVVEYNSHPTMEESPTIYNRYGFSAQLYMEYQFKKKIIFDVVDFVLKPIFAIKDKYKILILLNHIEHVDIMTDYIKDKYPNKIVGRFHSKVNAEEKEYTKNYSDIIVSTYSSFGTGLDVSHIKYVLSLNQSNKIEDNQAAGRARPLEDGSDVFYFMIIDRGFPYCMKKLKTRLQYLNETKIKKVSKLRYYT